MDKDKLNKTIGTDVHIEQVNSADIDEDIEKDKKKEQNIEEELSKTQQLFILNTRRKKVVEEFDLPKIVNKKLREQELDEGIELPKKASSLTDTIRIKLSDLRGAIEAQEKELEENNKPKKKSLYDTIIIKLDDIINNRKALRKSTLLKVIEINEPKYIGQKKKKIVKNITKENDLKLNVDSKEFISQLTNLNIIALSRLSSKKKTKIRNAKDYRKHHFRKKKIKKESYLAYKNELIEFATNKLYYDYSLKESKKYKLYKFSIAVSVLVFAVTSVVLCSWFVQGLSINNLSNTLVEIAPVETVEDGTIINSEYVEEVPVEEDGTLDQEVVRKNEMYWQYLNTPLSSVDFTELLKQNEDTVGWLIVNNTNINYPVVQTSNNDYYLKHAFDKSKNYAGWVYADFRNNFHTLSKNTVIYAHGRKDGVMFGSLLNTIKENWYTNTENQIIQLSTLKYNTMWQIFAIYKIEAESYYITTDFTTNAAFAEFANTLKARSVYDFGVELGETDKMLTLSTCYNDKGTRLVVHAKLVKIQER